MIICDNCGGENIQEATTCATCASLLSTSAVIHPDDEGRAGRVLRLILLAAALAGLGYAAHTVIRSGDYQNSKETVQAELERLQERDIVDQLQAAAGDSVEEEAEKAAAEAARRARLWVVQGKVYDIITLKPVGGVRIVFSDVGTGKEIVTESQGSGRYETELPKVSSGGYRLSVRHPRYSGVYTEEGYTPYHKQSLARRQDAWEMLRSMKIMHVPILPPLEDAGYDHNIVMVRLDRT